MKLRMLQNALSVLRIKLNLSCLRINEITDVFYALYFVMNKELRKISLY